VLFIILGSYIRLPLPLFFAIAFQLQKR